jgi:adenine phosphoribosyltransferase
MSIDLKEYIRAVPNWPIEGVCFRDLTTLMLDSEAFQKTCDTFYERYRDWKVDKVVGIDARGLIFGAPLAYHLGVGFVPCRKAGKLPCKTVSTSYNLEYGEASIEIHKDAIAENERILIVDDLLATGGTALAATRLVEELKGQVLECAFIVELTDLKGKEKLTPHKTYSILQFSAN